MSKEDFEKLFYEAMSHNTAYCDTILPNGEIISDSYEVEAKIIIRDFDIDVSDMQSSGVWDSSKVDKEFDNFEDAWNYIMGLRVVRIMDVNGNIIYDNYTKGDY